MPHLGETIEAGSVFLSEDPHRTIAIVDNHDRAVSTLVDEVQRITNRVARRQRDRSLKQWMPSLDPRHHRLDHVDGDVLREHRQSAAPCDHFGHPTTRHCGHIGDHHRDRRTDAIWG